MSQHMLCMHVWAKIGLADKKTFWAAGAAMKMQMFTSTPNIQKSIKPGSIRNDGIRQ